MCDSSVTILQRFRTFVLLSVPAGVVLYVDRVGVIKYHAVIKIHDATIYTLTVSCLVDMWVSLDLKHTPQVVHARPVVPGVQPYLYTDRPHPKFRINKSLLHILGSDRLVSCNPGLILHGDETFGGIDYFNWGYIAPKQWLERLNDLPSKNINK